MSISKSDIEKLIKNDFQTALTGYFNRPEESTENLIIAAFDATYDDKKQCYNGFEIKESCCAGHDQYRLVIKLKKYAQSDGGTPGMAPKDLRGALLRNRSRIESNLLTAVQKMIQAERPHWNAGIISKVIVEIG